MAKKLNETEREQILKLADWCICRNGDVLAYNSTCGNFQPVESFTLKNIPQFDALLIIGGYPRPVIHAGNVLRAYKQQYGTFPEFMTIGRGPNKGQVLTDSIAVLTENAMIMSGFDEQWVRKNHIEATSTDSKGNIEEIKYIVEHSAAMCFKNRPRIGVVSEPGYLLRLAQELSFFLPQYEFVYYETPVSKDKKRTFDCESLDGYGADVIIAGAWNSLRQWNERRLSLSQEKMKAAPTLEFIRKFVGYGYCFYMEPEMLAELGYSDDEISLMLATRRQEVLGVDAYGHKVGEPMPDADTEIFMDKVRKMIVSVKKN